MGNNAVFAGSLTPVLIAGLALLPVLLRRGLSIQAKLAAFLWVAAVAGFYLPSLRQEWNQMVDGGWQTQLANTLHLAWVSLPYLLATILVMGVFAAHHADTAFAIWYFGVLGGITTVLYFFITLARTGSS